MNDEEASLTPPDRLATCSRDPEAHDWRLGTEGLALAVICRAYPLRWVARDEGTTRIGLHAAQPPSRQTGACLVAASR